MNYPFQYIIYALLLHDDGVRAPARPADPGASLEDMAAMSALSPAAGRLDAPVLCPDQGLMGCLAADPDYRVAHAPA